MLQAGHCEIRQGQVCEEEERQVGDVVTGVHIVKRKVLQHSGAVLSPDKVMALELVNLQGSKEHKASHTFYMLSLLQIPLHGEGVCVLRVAVM